MRNLLAVVILLMRLSAVAQDNQSLSIFDGRAWGVVLKHPDAEKVTVKKDITYLSDAKGTLKMDIYLPPDIKAGDRRPAIIFLNAIGERTGQMKVKDWGTYSSWPRLMAANGYIGISMENDRERINEGIARLFGFIAEHGSEFQIDANKLGVYAASANVTGSLTYLMSKDAFSGIKAAVLYYGGYGEGPYRKDLPVMFLISEGDVRRNGYTTLWNEVLKNNAPWTIVMGSGLIHAFDSFTDNDDARKTIKETISFWKNHLDPIPTHTWTNSVGREFLAAHYGRNNEKAMVILKNHIDKNPNDAEALLQYGNMLVADKNYKDAEAVLKRGLAIDPSKVNAMANLAVVYYGLDQKAEAEKLLAKIGKSGKATRDTWSDIGMGLYILGKHKEGLKFLEKIVNPLHVDYYNIACGYAILNDKDKAFVALNKAASMGYDAKDQYVNDPDLTSLRSDPRYQELLLKLK